MLDACPRCDYSLRGLPAEHACPECGLRYDARSFSWRARLPRVAFLGLLGFAYGGFAVYRVVFMQPVPHAVARLVFFLMLLGMGAAFVVMVIKLIVFYRRGRLVATLPDGLWLRLDRPDSTVIPWDNISRVAFRPGFRKPGAVVFLRKERTVRDVVGVFRNRADAERFVEAATSYIIDRPLHPPADD